MGGAINDTICRGHDISPPGVGSAKSSTSATVHLGYPTVRGSYDPLAARGLFSASWDGPGFADVRRA
jgi:hypothetical protein